jgi:hypothetical protein
MKEMEPIGMPKTLIPFEGVQKLTRGEKPK